MGETFTSALAISKEDIEALWEKTWEAWDIESLRSLNAHTPPELSWEVYRAEDGTLTLWLGPSKLATVRR